MSQNSARNLAGTQIGAEGPFWDCWSSGSTAGSVSANANLHYVCSFHCEPAGGTTDHVKSNIRKNDSEPAETEAMFLFMCNFIVHSHVYRCERFLRNQPSPAAPRFFTNGVTKVRVLFGTLVRTSSWNQVVVPGTSNKVVQNVWDSPQSWMINDCTQKSRNVFRGPTGPCGSNKDSVRSQEGLSVWI